MKDKIRGKNAKKKQFLKKSASLILFTKICTTFFSKVSKFLLI